MHEYGIVCDLLSQVDENVRAHAGRRAVRVCLSVSGMVEAEERLLRVAFDTFKAGSTAGDAELVVEHAPSEVCCLDCGSQSSLAGGNDPGCPRCGSGATLPVHGEAIFLKSVEIEV